MKHSEFVHLHNHTEYSLLDGASKIKPLLSAAAKLRMPALAMTDHGNMFGAVDFYFAAMKAGIKPIIGCEVYIAPGARTDKTNVHGENYHHLLLLCRDLEGYQNLVKLVSAGYMEGFYYKPRIDQELLLKHSKGLICLSACLKGEIASLILKDKQDEARTKISHYNDLFGAGNFYLEIMDHKIDDQYTVNNALIKLSKEMNVPLVATNDCHYILKQHSKLHDILLCIQTKRNFDDIDRMRFHSAEFYLKSEDEMRKVFEFVPEALKNTLVISEKCNFKMPEGKLILPDYKVPEGFTLESYFDHLTLAGMKEKYGAEPEQAIVARTKYELETIKRLNFAAYFLIVWDFIKYAKDNGIYVGAGRGSAAGSIVAYCLSITETDPLKYNLFFERFLNPERISPPDIDIDFEDERRDEVFKYVKEKYGKDNVSQIITFMTLKRKAAIKAVGRVLAIPYQDVNKITKMIPSKIVIEEGKEEPTLMEIVKTIKELDDWVRRDEKIKSMMEYANDIEGLKSDVSTHAAGVVISKTALVNYVPLYKEPGEDEILTQFEKNCVEKIGLLKMDFLGLKTLTVIRDCIENIKKERGISLDPNKLPLEDKKAFQILCEAKSAGIFQLESTGMKDLLRKMKPQTIYDIIALIALYRPGPMDWIDDFVKRKHGLVPIKYAHPDLVDVLKETYGIMLYQEQVMQAAVKLANFTMGQADTLRKAMSKKDPEKMEEQRQLFVKGAVEKKSMKADKAEKIFDEIAKFAGYGFNKSHSASYAIVSYQTAFLKANYPLEYYAALLSSDINNVDKIGIYVDELRKSGFELHPPCINNCETKFAVHDNKVFFALSAIKNVGGQASDSFIKERVANGPFKSLQDFANRVDLRIANKEVFQSLILSGAFDCFGEKRLKMQRMADDAVATAQKNQEVTKSGQDFLFENMAEQVQKHYPDDEFAEDRLLSFEKQLLGIYLSGHPLLKYQDQMKHFISNSVHSLNEVEDSSTVTLGGIVARLELKTTKKNLRMAVLELEDLGGKVEVVVFPKLFERVHAKLAEEALVIIKGRVDIEDNGSDNPEENGTPKIIAEEILLLEEARGRLYKKAHIKIMTLGLDDMLLSDLKKTLALYDGRGGCQVFLHFYKSADQLEDIIETPLKVSPNVEMIRYIEENFGENSIWFSE